MHCSAKPLISLEEICLKALCTNLVNANDSLALDLSELPQPLIQEVFNYLNTETFDDKRSTDLFLRVHRYPLSQLDLRDWDIRSCIWNFISRYEFRQETLTRLILSPKSFSHETLDYAFEDLKKVIVKYPALTFIEMVGFSFEHASHCALANLGGQIKSFSLDNCSFASVAFLKNLLENLPELEELAINGDPEIEQLDVPKPAGLNILELMLELDSTGLNLEYHPDLEEMGIQTPDPVFDANTPRPSVERLNLTNATVMYEGLPKLLALLPTLKKITLSEFQDHHRIQKEEFGEHLLIEQLEIYDSYITASTFIQLLQKFPNLKKLTLRQGNFSKDTLNYILLHGKNITHLVFQGFFGEGDTQEGIIQEFNKCLKAEQRVVDHSIELEPCLEGDLMTQILLI